MATSQDCLSRIVRAVDRLMRWRLRIWEFNDDPDCLLRVGLIRCPQRVELRNGGFIERGEVIGIAHIWNERVPPLPSSGANLAWAREVRRRLIRSFQLLAQAAQEDPRLMNVRGFGGYGALEFSPGIMSLLERLGIEIYELPVRTPRQWVEKRVNLIWTWLLRRAFNPPSTQGRGPELLKRRFYWLSRERLLALYGSNVESQTEEVLLRPITFLPQMKHRAGRRRRVPEPYKPLEE